MIELDGIIRKTLTPYELEFVSEESIEKRENSRKNLAHVARENSCYVRKLDCHLESFMDIAMLFSDRENFSDFLNYLFISALRLKKDGGSPYLYHRPTNKYGSLGKKVTYVFDYNFILMVITEWAVNVLGADNSNFRRFIAKFSSGNSGAYAKQNYFLVVSIFSHMYMLNTLPYTSFKINPSKKFRLEIEYFTPYVVRTIIGNEYYFLGIPLDGAESLKYLSDDVISSLFSMRIQNNLFQVKFGRDAKQHSNSGEDSLGAFWKIAHPSVEK